MKRNKIVSLAAASVLALTILAGCGSEDKGNSTSEFKDGKYRVEYDKADTRGWKAFVELTVKGGKITEADYDYVNDKGARKSEDAEYNKAMMDKAKTNPETYLPQLEKALVEKQDISKVDKVTGATHSWEGFKELASELIEKNVKKGETATLKIAQPDVKKESALKDGTYKAEYDKADTHNWKAFVEITVKDGKMSAVNFDYVNADGKFKSEDAAYNESMMKVAKTNPATYMPQLEKALVEKQDVAKVDSVTGATASSKNFTTLASKLVTEKIAKGDTTTLVIPQTDVK